MVSIEIYFSKYQIQQTATNNAFLQTENQKTKSIRIHLHCFIKQFAFRKIDVSPHEVQKKLNDYKF